MHETLVGGFCTAAVRAIFRFKQMARAGLDNTKYRRSTTHISFLAHHTQSISTAITREDSRALYTRRLPKGRLSYPTVARAAARKCAALASPCCPSRAGPSALS